MFHKLIIAVASFLLAPGIVFAAGTADNNVERVVNVYSHRHYDVDRMLFDEFEEETGIKVNVVQAKADELIERMISEGKASPADLLITVDAGRLIRAKNEGLLQSVESDRLMQSVPNYLRDSEGYWYGLTKRARVIVWDKEKMDSPSISSYGELSDPELGQKILVRSSSNIYNISLLSYLIEAYGEDFASKWVNGVVKNMAREPQGNDRDQMKALVAGLGDYAIVNTYYVGLLISSSDPEEERVGKRIGIIFPDQDGKGTHVNVSGAGVAANAPNRENAIKLMEFLTSAEVQKTFAEKNYEYPVNVDAPVSSIVSSWGDFKESKVDLFSLGGNTEKAVVIFDEAGWR